MQNKTSKLDFIDPNKQTSNNNNKEAKKTKKRKTKNKTKKNQTVIKCKFFLFRFFVCPVFVLFCLVCLFYMILFIFYIGTKTNKNLIFMINFIYCHDVCEWIINGSRRWLLFLFLFFLLYY